MIWSKKGGFADHEALSPYELIDRCKLRGVPPPIHTHHVFEPKEARRFLSVHPELALELPALEPAVEPAFEPAVETPPTRRRHSVASGSFGPETDEEWANENYHMLQGTGARAYGHHGRGRFFGR